MVIVASSVDTLTAISGAISFSSQMSIALSVSSFRNDQRPVGHLMPGLADQLPARAELGEPRGFECYPMECRSGAPAGISHRFAKTWRVGQRRFHLPREPLGRTAKYKRRKTPPVTPVGSANGQPLRNRISARHLVCDCSFKMIVHCRVPLFAPTLLPSRDAVGRQRLLGWKMRSMKSLGCGLLSVRCPTSRSSY